MQRRRRKYQKNMQLPPVWKKQTELGKLYKLSGVAFGHLLQKAGLKDGPFATRDAIFHGFAKRFHRPGRDAKYLWHMDKVIAELRHIGIEPVAECNRLRV